MSLYFLPTSGYDLLPKRLLKLINVTLSSKNFHDIFVISTAQTLVKQIFASGANLNDSSGYHLLKCPVCETPIEGSEEELVTHVQRCLKKVFLQPNHRANTSKFEPRLNKTNHQYKLVTQGGLLLLKPRGGQDNEDIRLCYFT